MAFVCPQGHANLNPTAQFCVQCGLPLVQADQAPPLAPSSAGPARPPLACARHPESAGVPCPRCGTFSCSQCLVRLPDGSELCGDCAARQSQLLPWDQRAELGTLRAFWQTSIRILSRPTVTFGTASPSGTIGSSLGFTVLATLTAWVTTFALYAMLFGVIGVAALMNRGADSKGMGGAEAGVVILIAVASTLLFLGMSVAGVLFNAALDHLVLKLVGARPRSFSVTLRASALSLAPSLVGLIPVCGLYVWPIWTVVLRIFAYRAFHQTTLGKAVLGALLVPGVLVVLGMVSYVALILVAQAGILDQ
ncbi:MAG: YIP1 family protein [Myxococcota bacterium]|nr:YIP1 family protein [Myxococcota bacterium]